MMLKEKIQKRMQVLPIYMKEVQIINGNKCKRLWQQIEHPGPISDGQLELVAIQSLLVPSMNVPMQRDVMNQLPKELLMYMNVVAMASGSKHKNCFRQTGQAIIILEHQ